MPIFLGVQWKHPCAQNIYIDFITSLPLSKEYPQRKLLLPNDLGNSSLFLGHLRARRVRRLQRRRGRDGRQLRQGGFQTPLLPAFLFLGRSPREERSGQCWRNMEEQWMFGGC